MSAFQLKLIAFITMLIDHTALALPFFRRPENQGLYELMRGIGRLAFPLFAFLLAEGAVRTRSMGRYLLRLGVMALLCELPFDYMRSGVFFDWSTQNICLTLFLGLWGIRGCQMMLRQEEAKRKVLPLAGGLILLTALAAAYFLRADYGSTGVLLIIGFYMWRTDLKEVKAYPFFLMLVMGALWVNNPRQLPALLAFLLIILYNGMLGKKVPRYSFYGAYLGQLIVLALLRHCLT